MTDIKLEDCCLCAICLDVLKKPIIAFKCCHMLCSLCFGDYKKTFNKDGVNAHKMICCPICFQTTSITPPIMMLQHEELINIVLSNKQKGCCNNNNNHDNINNDPHIISIKTDSFIRSKRYHKL